MDGYNQKIIDILKKNKLSISSIEVGTDGLIASMLSLPNDSKEVYASGMVFSSIEKIKNYFSIESNEANAIINNACVLICRKFKVDCSICSLRDGDDIYTGIVLLDKFYINKTNFDNRTLAAASSLVFLSNLLKGMDK